RHSCITLHHHPSTPESYPLSLHDALPILVKCGFRSCAINPIVRFPTSTRLCTPFRSVYIPALARNSSTFCSLFKVQILAKATSRDRKSTRLNSSHVSISYAVFCLKKKRLN